MTKKTPDSNKGGRPSKYLPVYAEQCRKMALLGLTDAEMARVLGVAMSTFHLWKKEHAGFSDAILRGREAADADVAVSLYERAKGYSHQEVVITSYQGEITKTRVTKHYPPDTQAAAIWLYNRQPKLWRRVPDDKQGDDAPPPVKVVIEVKDASVQEPT